MQVDRAAPIPVPVHIRMPRLYSVEVFDTPANYEMCHDLRGIRSNDEDAANLEFAGPNRMRRIVDEAAGEVTFAEQL